jgi:integrase
VRHTWERAKARVLADAKEAGGPREALLALEATLEDLRPYDLRHSFATEVLKRSKDIRAVKELLQHADIRTTERYVEGAVDEGALDAIAALEASFTRGA